MFNYAQVLLLIQAKINFTVTIGKKNFTITVVEITAYILLLLGVI